MGSFAFLHKIISSDAGSAEMIGGKGMKAQAGKQFVERKKVVAVGSLFVVSVAITLVGLAFCVYSTLNKVEFMVLTSKVPGAVFGAVIMFLGVRYLLAVQKLKTEVYKTTSRFSWGNFKK